MSKRPIGYFEADGSYNEREPRRVKPRIDDSFRLDFDKSIAFQVSLVMTHEQQVEIARCVGAYRTLLAAGCLPGNRYLQMQRQINLKADRYVRKFKKTVDPNCLEGPGRTPEEMAAERRELNRIAPTPADKFALMFGLKPGVIETEAP